jgi:hypothetical protein
MEKRKETETKFNKLPANAIDFIKLVIDKMRYRKKVRQDVQAELSAHFEDELKDCASDEDKEQKAQHLIANFGDVKLLAVLLRRAKKRCRPLWRTVVTRTFQAVGIIIVCFIFYTIWFISGDPAIKIDYLARLNQMNQPELRDEDNAWPYYEKAINLYIEPVKGGVVEEFISYRGKSGKLEDILRFTDLSEEQQTQILQWIQQNQKHWDNLSTEQQAVILKCFNYNWVPIFRQWQPAYTPFNSMTSQVIEAVKENKQITEPQHIVAAGPEHSGFPAAELTDWIKQDKVPANFLEAVSVAVLNEWIKRYKELPKSAWVSLTDTEYEYIGPWIKQNEPAWQEFVAGSSKPYCYREYVCDPNKEDKSLFDIILPNLGTLRKLARLGIWQSRTNLKKGQIRQGLEDCLDVVRAGSHWQGKGTIVEQLVGIAISAIAHDEILHIMAMQNLSSTDLKQIHQQLSEVYNKGYPTMNMEGERLAFLDIVQHVFTDSGPGGGHLIPDRWHQWMQDNRFYGWQELKLLPLFTAASMVHARRDETLAKANEFYNRCAENAKITPYEKHIDKLGNTEKMLFSLPEYRYFLLRYFMPAVDRVSEFVYRGKVTHESTVAILALKRWQLENKEYPENLNELVTAGLLKELPIDPFSDRPVVYKKMNNDFILYSIGPNFIDDGGEPGMDRNGRAAKWRDNGDMVFWPVQK